LRTVLVLFCTLVLAGCGMVRLPRGEASPLEANDAVTADSPDAVLVYGVTLRQPDAQVSGKVGGDVTWLLEKTDQSFPTMITIAFPDGIQPNRRTTVAWRVPAGTWSVRQVTWHDDSRSGGTLPAAGHALATTVAAGQVTYAGEIVIESGRQPAELSIGDDAAAARAALAPYAAVTAPLADLPLKDLRTAGEPGRRRPGLTP
jgi:hypothetical protein